MAAHQQTDRFPIFLGGILFGTIITVGSLMTTRITPSQMQEVSMSYTDFITVMLTAVTVVITILAIFIAILAFWGYSQFQKMTETASKNHMDKLLLDGPFAKRIEEVIIQHISDQLQKGELRKILVERIDGIILSDASQRDERAKDSGDKPYTD